MNFEYLRQTFAPMSEYQRFIKTIWLSIRDLLLLLLLGESKTIKAWNLWKLLSKIWKEPLEIPWIPMKTFCFAQFAISSNNVITTEKALLRSSHYKLLLKKVFFFASWCWHIHKFPCFRRTFQNTKTLTFHHRSMSKFKEQVNVAVHFSMFYKDKVRRCNIGN